MPNPAKLIEIIEFIADFGGARLWSRMGWLETSSGRGNPPFFGLFFDGRRARTTL
jgi:hypothetical protein